MIRVQWFTVLLFLMGCAPEPKISEKMPGRYEIGSSYAISTSIDWTHIPYDAETWTIYGPHLGALRTWADLQEGDDLYFSNLRDFSKSYPASPKVASDMDPAAVAELVAETIETYIAETDVDVSDLRPAAFGARDGFRFDIAYVANDLRYRGVAAGACHDAGVDLMLFMAPVEHYFELQEAEIERIFGSVETL